jgi:hypothetical protein
LVRPLSRGEEIKQIAIAYEDRFRFGSQLVHCSAREMTRFSNQSFGFGCEMFTHGPAVELML